MKRFKKILKIIGAILIVLLIGLLIAANILLTPKSDAKIRTKLTTSVSAVELDHLLYKEHSIRRIQMQKELDSTKLTLVFVHGSPGSLLDFSAYLTDSLLLATYNMIAYDRVGYGEDQPGKILGTLEEELEVLDVVTAEIPAINTILAGYSYGGPVVLASPKHYREKITFAPAIAADLEPQFWVLKLCEWSLTRWMIPNVLNAAADEKAAHRLDLPKYSARWNISPAPVTNVQGLDDWIVPYENSKRLETYIAPDKFRQIDFEETGHELIWSHFEDIKTLLLNLNTQP